MRIQKDFSNQKTHHSLLGKIPAPLSLTLLERKVGTAKLEPNADKKSSCETCGIPHDCVVSEREKERDRREGS